MSFGMDTSPRMKLINTTNAIQYETIRARMGNFRGFTADSRTVTPVA